MVATSHMWQSSAWGMASLDWDALLTVKYTQTMEDLFKKKKKKTEEGKEGGRKEERKEKERKKEGNKSSLINKYLNKSNI